MSLSVNSVYWAADRHMKTIFISFSCISHNYTSNKLFSARIYTYIFAGLDLQNI